ncbi:MAG: iron-containing alcohol dehydrogenase family protein [Eubacteriales bacterium]|nr:iron-containing alcohol dehydrogenase family protein [Eubacteriales bacterium]
MPIMYMPVKVLWGKGAVAKNREVFVALGSKAMIVTGKHSSRVNGSLQDVTDALDANGQTYVIFDEIEENPSVETVSRAAALAVEEKADFFIGIGGGSPMDASKAIALLARNPEMIADAEKHLYQKQEVPVYPVAAVPTTSGTGSEVTPYAIMTLHSRHTKQSIAYRIFPQVALVDYSYLKTSSRNGMINTCVDALAHMLESYLNTNADEYNRMYAEKGLRLWGSKKEQLAGAQEEYTEEMYQTFMHASVLAGMAIAHTGTSLPHGLSYPVTYELGVAHGRAVGYFLPGFLKYYGNQEEVQEVLQLLGFENQEAFAGYLNSLLGEKQIPEELWERDRRGLLSNQAKLKNYPFEMTEETLSKYI